MSQDLIDRNKLIKNLKAVEAVTKRDSSNFRWESIYKTVNTAKSEEVNCTECVISGLWKDRIGE